MQRDGVCLSFCRYPQGKGQNKAPGYILPWTTWAPSVQFSASSRLCACRCIFYYPRNQVKKGGFFSCRPAEASDHRLAQAGRVDRVPLPERTVPPVAAAAACC